MVFLAWIFSKKIFFVASSYSLILMFHMEVFVQVTNFGRVVGEMQTKSFLLIFVCVATNGKLTYLWGPKTNLYYYKVLFSIANLLKVSVPPMDVFTAIMHQKHNLILCLLFIVSIAYYHS
jgi:hypothetical protein